MACSQRGLIEEQDIAAAVPPFVPGNIGNARGADASSPSPPRRRGMILAELELDELELTLSINCSPAVRPHVYTSIPGG